MIRSLAAFLLICTLSGSAWAHGGGLDALGCHHNRKLGGYHCHRGPLAGQSFASKEEALRALKGSQQAPQQAPPQVQSPSVSGQASVIDGDTIEIHGERIRILDVDAPESAQTCTKLDGTQWRCGQKAALALADWIGQRTVDCASTGYDKYGRLLARCAIGAEDVAKWLAANGWAVPYRDCKCEVVREAAAGAKREKKGIWTGEFEPPWEWRARRL